MENAVAILPTTRVDLQRGDLWNWNHNGLRGLLLLAQFVRRNGSTQRSLPLPHACLLGVVLVDHRSGTTNSAAKCGIIKAKAGRNRFAKRIIGRG